MNATHMKNHHRQALIAAVITLMPVTGFAGGFEVGVNGSRATARGGAFVVRADDLTAIDHNPGGLSRLKGTHLTLSHNTVNSRLTFTRAESSVPQPPINDPGSPNPFEPVSNQDPWFALGGMFVAATDFGLEDFTFAIGAYGPSAAGRQSYDLRGGSRWMLTELDAVMVYYSAAVAYGKKNWGVGATLQLAHQPSTRLGLVVDGTTGGPQSPYSSAADVLATIDLSAPPTFTAILGAWFQPEALRSESGFWEFAVSARVLPVVFNATGDVTMSNTPGGSQFSPSQLEVSDSSAAMELTIPPVVRAGVRYVHLSGGKEIFDVELNAVYERWSMLDAYKMDLEGTINLFAAAEAPDVIIAKNWQDTLAIRLGGTYQLGQFLGLGSPLGLSFGGYYETAAVPVNYSHLDFPSFARIGLGVGVQGQVGGLQWSVAYAHVFQEQRVVDERYAKVYQQRPIAECPDGCDGFDSIPANAGTFDTGFSTVSVSFSYGF